MTGRYSCAQSGFAHTVPRSARSLWVQLLDAPPVEWQQVYIHTLQNSTVYVVYYVTHYMPIAKRALDY